jgi:hypothetical protein
VDKSFKDLYLNSDEGSSTKILSKKTINDEFKSNLYRLYLEQKNSSKELKDNRNSSFVSATQVGLNDSLEESDNFSNVSQKFYPYRPRLRPPVRLNHKMIIEILLQNTCTRLVNF